MAGRAVLVLLRGGEATPPPPERRPMGRALLALGAEGLDLRVGTAEGCWRARPGGWDRCDADGVEIIYDRFPSWTWPDDHARALGGLARLPRANPPALQALCRDKLACQRALEARGLAMPALEDDPSAFAGRLAGWGAGFLKPRHGALGRGVRRVRPGDALPARGPGAVRGQDDALILQRAVPPPAGFASLSLRALVQREATGAWVVAPLVARCSETDWVANVDRGARALPAEDLLPPATLDRARAACLEVAEALGAAHEPAVELGVDLVVDPDGHPHLIEVNGRPGGRLEALRAADGARFAAAHEAAMARPLRALALGRFLR